MEHVSDQILERFGAGRLSPEERLALLSHVSQCDDCAALLADAAQCLRTPAPPCLIPDALYALRAQKYALERRRFAGYCLRVGLAVCASLLLLFSGLFDAFPVIRLPEPSPVSITQKMSDGLSSFADALASLEVFDHDKKAQ